MWLEGVEPTLKQKQRQDCEDGVGRRVQDGSGEKNVFPKAAQ